MDTVSELVAELAQRRRQLASLPKIEQAKGMLMLLQSWDEQRAFATLKAVSQATNVKVHDVASIVVATGASGTREPLPECAELVLARLRELFAHCG
ncbi:ANTAR domain-containing protein [Amycolatopsis magusensis]|uniref:ANTAR domain-containing protein n=1 Tax=Amycolatopsis magusensis TaxID=882444 RepID=UPI00378B1D84